MKVASFFSLALVATASFSQESAATSYGENVCGEKIGASLSACLDKNLRREKDKYKLHLNSELAEVDKAKLENDGGPDIYQDWKMQVRAASTAYEQYLSAACEVKLYEGWGGSGAEHQKVICLIDGYHATDE